MRKVGSFQEMVLKQLDIHMKKKINLDSYHTAQIYLTNKNLREVET